ncbi:MAG: TolB family protein [Chloroflexaceae bacterium]|nr:TolB family protein [Chloroflexaceae bacterium]
MLVAASVLLLGLSGCDRAAKVTGPVLLNSRYQDEQPALSGDGRWLAFTTNRNGRSEILLYDLQEQRFAVLNGLNPQGAILESPSLSWTARYVVFLANGTGRPEIVFYDRLTGRSQALNQPYRSWLRHPAVSPDGRYIVFETSRRGQWDVEILDRGPNVELDCPTGFLCNRPLQPRTSRFQA